MKFPAIAFEAVIKMVIKYRQADRQTFCKNSKIIFRAFQNIHQIRKGKHFQEFNALFGQEGEF